ncbi:MAG: sulfite oxidase-like oxidoreductase [Sulfolobales archaeon]
MRCSVKTPQSLLVKGIGMVLECLDVGMNLANPIDDIKAFLIDLIDDYVNVGVVKVEFTENEPIGTNYVIFKYHLFNESGFISSCRAVLRKKVLEEVLCTFGAGKAVRVQRGSTSEAYEPKLPPADKRSSSGPAPGQYYIDHFIIYRVLGTPKIDLNSWKLRVEGMVRNALELTFSDIEKLPKTSLIRDFHCVTGWSVSSVKWEGVKLKLIVDEAGPYERAKWVFVTGLDGYSSVIPLEDFTSEDALLVIKINDRPLTVEQGFPARIFVPHLYGWKSVKWVSRIEFIDRYVDGYWEALGYHERGNVFLEERFKKTLL